MRLYDKRGHNVHSDGNSEHLAPALKIFYSMVLGQGTLYILACISEFLFFPSLRGSLARALSDAKEEFQSVDLYYDYAHSKCMEDGILDPEDLGLVRFAVDSLNSNSRTKKLAAVQIMHSLLLPQGANKKLDVSEIITSTKAVVTLISMLGWTCPIDQDIRLLAAKITAELAGDLLIVGIPGTIQLISSLLDSEAKRHSDEDSFPVQGMIILKRLAHDLHNCEEISRATGLIPKIVGFISKDTASISEEQHNLIMTTSLKLVARLARVEGEIGIALRRKILEQPFLLSNLIEILEGSNGCLDQWGAAIFIIAKLAVDEETRQKIGDFQAIIPKLTQTFLCRNESSKNTYCDNLVLRVVAGEALSKLAKEKTSYCSAILEETRYDVIEHLKNMLQEDEYAYDAASILWNLCGHSKDKLLHLGSLNIRLMSTLPVVLAKVMDTRRNKQLEALLVLASQLYNLNPERFTYEAVSHTNARRLVQKLVGALNSNQKFHPEYPRLRRGVLEVTIFIVESCPRYSTIFREEGMMEALSKVEIALLMVEKYKVFLGKREIMERGLHLPDLLVKAKQLIGSTTPISAT
ncbi:hypothetical protein HU200_047513 [Digitaria exilis]|uniref:ARM repeat superfamily protein n=1 Tax=Digitaria exilis TaxID=1010633 RepID=A0A835AXI1_9POAL|nr:hypothetical protein HU200_047513 [Digitaria exilis]